MRSLPAEIFYPIGGTGEILKEATFQRHLFKLVVGMVTYYWTDCDQPIWFDGKYWTPYGIEFSDLSYSLDQSVASCQLTIPNVNNAFSDLSLSVDLRNKAFTIYRVWLTNYLGVIGCTDERDLPVVFDGVIDSLPNSDREIARVNLVSFGVAGGVTTPRRTIDAACSWIRIGGFKGPYCTYAGAGAWCDGSKARCVELKNELFFGGWEEIATLQNQNIYWCRKQKFWGKK